VNGCCASRNRLRSVRRTTARRMAAHRKSNRRGVYLCVEITRSAKRLASATGESYDAQAQHWMRVNEQRATCRRASGEPECAVLLSRGWSSGTSPLRLYRRLTEPVSAQAQDGETEESS
jgi:hypothetical protein